MKEYTLKFIKTDFDERTGYAIHANPSALPFLDINRFQYPEPKWGIEIGAREGNVIEVKIDYKSQIVSNPPLNMEMCHVQTYSTFEIQCGQPHQMLIPLDKEFDNALLNALKESQLENDKKYKKISNDTELKYKLPKRFDEVDALRELRNKFSSHN